MKKKTKKRKIAVEDTKGVFSAEKRKVRSEEKRIKKKKAGLRLKIAKSNLIASGRIKEKLKTLGEKLEIKHAPTTKEIAFLSDKLKKLRKKQKVFNMKKIYLKKATEKVNIHVKNTKSKIRDLRKSVRKMK